MSKVYFFTSEDCTPCKIMKAQIDFSKYDNVIEVDVKNDQQLAQTYGVSSIPTFIMIDDNEKEVFRLVGSRDVKTVLNLISEA